MTTKKACKVIVTAYPLAIDKGLWRGLYLVLALESIGLFPGTKPLIVDSVAMPFKLPFGFKTVGADMVLHDHAKENSFLLQGISPEYESRATALRFLANPGTLNR